MGPPGLYILQALFKQGCTCFLGGAERSLARLLHTARCLPGTSELISPRVPQVGTSAAQSISLYHRPSQRRRSRLGFSMMPLITCDPGPSWRGPAGLGSRLCHHCCAVVRWPEGALLLTCLLFRGLEALTQPSVFPIYLPLWSVKHFQSLCWNLLLRKSNHERAP